MPPSNKLTGMYYNIDHKLGDTIVVTLDHCQVKKNGKYQPQLDEVEYNHIWPPSPLVEVKKPLEVKERYWINAFKDERYDGLLWEMIAVTSSSARWAYNEGGAIVSNNFEQQ